MSTASVPKMDMSCPQCGAKFKVPLSAAGKKGRCAKCQTLIPIPLAPPAEPILDAEVLEAQVMPAGPSLAPLTPTGLDPFGASPGLTPLQAAPAQPSFDDALGDYKLMNDAPPATSLPPTDPFAPSGYATNPYAPSANATYAPSGAAGYGDSGFMSRIFSAGMLGGIGAMLLAVIWFVGGILFLDRIFFYPPIMFILGFVSCVKSLFK